MEISDDGLTRTARVDFSGTVRVAQLDLLPEAVAGDYVLVHVGMAISRVDAEDARQTLDLLRQAGFE